MFWAKNHPKTMFFSPENCQNMMFFAHKRVKLIQNSFWSQKSVIFGAKNRQIGPENLYEKNCSVMDCLLICFVSLKSSEMFQKV